MKLTAKIILIYMLAAGLMTSLFGYAIVRREDERLRQELEKQAHSVGVAMERELIVAWQSEGNEGAGRMIGSFDGRHQQMAIRWIALDVRRFEPAPAATVEQLKSADGGRVLTVVSGGFQRSYYPIDVGGERAGCIEFAQPHNDIERYTRGTIYQICSLILALLACGGIVALLGIRLVGRPLERLIEKTKRIGEGDFSGPLELEGNDELSQLASAVNNMSQKLAEQQQRIHAESSARVAAVEQLRHVDRLNTVGRLASGVAHELGTPLNIVSGRAELIASGRLDEQQRHESALAIKSEADRMTHIIRQLLDFARRRTPQRTSVNLRNIVDQSVELLRAMAKKHDVELLVTGSESLAAHVDAGQIQQVLTNLVVNAIQAMPEGGSVTIDLHTTRARHPEGGANTSGAYCCISVADEGVGIAEEHREHLFEPFFTTKEVGHGTGLGLSVSYGIVQDHGGWIEVQSEPGQGSRFTVFLPQNET